MCVLPSDFRSSFLSLPFLLLFLYFFTQTKTTQPTKATQPTTTISWNEIVAIERLIFITKVLLHKLGQASK